MKVNIVTADDWDLIVTACGPSMENNLPHNVMNEAYVAAWKFTDAYGEQGYMPPQGYDWSGFRDSSQESNRCSANAIRAVLALHSITEFQSKKRWRIDENY